MTSIKGKIFLDTNIFVYSIDSSAEQKEKRDVARKLVKTHIREESGVISIQVIQEFFQVATTKIRTPIPVEDALEFMQYMASLQIVPPDSDMVVAAVRIHQKHFISFWDALILQAAKTADCFQVLSEDLQDGFRLDDLTVKNPFVS
jgi:predicted nucleic acid-binding protein